MDSCASVPPPNEHRNGVAQSPFSPTLDKNPSTTDSVVAMEDVGITSEKKEQTILSNLLRESLHKTFNFFCSDQPGKYPMIAKIPFPVEPQRTYKEKTEYNVLVNTSGVHANLGIKDQQQQPLAIDSGIISSTTGGTTSIGSVRNQENTGTNTMLPFKTHENKTNIPAVPSGILTNLQSKGSSSNALQHLTFRHPPKIPKATKHSEWELMRVISGHQGWVRTLCVEPNNEWFVSGGNDRLIKIWDLASGTLKLSLTGHINTIRSVKVSHRHPYLFSCGEDQMVKCWDLEYNKVIRHYHGHLSGVYSMDLHPTLDILFTGGRDAVVRVWDMRTKLALHVLTGHTATVMSLLSQRHEPQIISGSLDKMIRCWNIVAGKTSVVLTHHKKAVRSLAVHPREYTFCSASADYLKVWKCPLGNFERNLEAVNMIMNCVTIRDDNESAVVIGGSDQGHLHFWDWNSGQKFQTIETIPQPGSLSSEKAIYDVCLDMSETRLFTAECDKTIKVWREKTP